MSRLYTLYHFDDGKRTPWVVGGDPCSLLRRGEIGREMGIRCELVSPDGEVVWPEPKHSGEGFLEHARRRGAIPADHIPLSDGIHSVWKDPSK